MVPLDVIYEDNHLLVVNKPAGLPTMGVASHLPSLLTRAKEYIKEKYGKPGNVYLGIVSRLDAPVTGVVLMARTSKAAARLTEQFRERGVQKVYWAIVEGHAQPREASLCDFVRKDDRHRRMHIASPQTPGARQAELSYRTIRRLRDATLLEVQLETGRKHQIRVQLAHRGFPIVGDRKYGSTKSFPDGIALHARALALEHPVRREPLRLVARLPTAWRKFGITDGDAGA